MGGVWTGGFLWRVQDAAIKTMPLESSWLAVQIVMTEHELAAQQFPLSSSFGEAKPRPEDPAAPKAICSGRLS
jgi:hypothetical protein